MKYLLFALAAIYHLLLLPCVAGLILIIGISNWETGDGFIFNAALWGIIIFLPLATWATLLYRKWPVKFGPLQVILLGGILLSLILATVYFFTG